MNGIKDPLGVVRKWEEQASGVTPSDDAKYPLVVLLIGAGLVAGAVGIIWALSLLF